MDFIAENVLLLKINLEITKIILIFVSEMKNKNIMKKYYKATSLHDSIEQLVVAEDYAQAVEKLMGMGDFEYLFGEGFEIKYIGEIIV